MSAVPHETHGHAAAGHHGEAHGDHGDIGFLRKYVFSVDHKVIALQFLFMGLMFMVVGGLLAMLIRWQMAWPSDWQKDHPVPILSMTVFSKVDATKSLGAIESVDSNHNTVTVGHVGWQHIRANDPVSIKPAAGGADVTGKVTDVEGGRATVEVPAAALSSLKAGDAVNGKRVPGPMPSDFYNMVFSMHATIMIFFVLIPLLVGTFGNYLIPLKIGAPDMAFPFLNGLVFWTALPAGAIMIAGFFMQGGAAAAGWTSYPPLSAIEQNVAPWKRTVPSYERPETALDHVGGFLRIDGRLRELGEAKYDAAAKTMTVMLPEGADAAAVTSTKTAATAGVTLVQKELPKADLKGVAIGTKAQDGRQQLTFAGADEPTARALVRATQDRLRWQGSWSSASLIAGFLAMAGMFGFICAYYVKLGNGVVNAVVGIALSVVGGYFVLKGVQFAAFDGQSAWFASLILLGFSSLMGAVNYLTTIIKLRCPGMTMFRLPLSVWSLFITSLLVLLATPVLASALSLNLLDHHRLTSFFLPTNWTRSNNLQMVAGGGYPLLHQHLFWFYSHPAVYIMILPAMGMVSDILAVFSRKPIFGYRPMVYAMAGIAFLGFIVWAHHMFQSGMNPALGTAFAIATMFIAVPSAIKVFNWLGTIWRGNIQFTVPMLNALGFVSMFVIGGLSGIFMASTAVDVHIHGTYFIVAHIHYVLFGGSIFGIFAAITFWYPKMFGKMMSETMGKVHFWLTFLSFNGTFFTMHILGLRGMPRRVADYTNYNEFADLRDMNVFITMCAFVMGATQVLFIVNFIGSWVWGKAAGRNPWLASTLEWVDADSPPVHGNFDKTPVVYHGPYEYSSPLVAEDWLAQTRYVEGSEQLVVAH